MIRFSRGSALASLFLVPLLASAASYVVPPDRDLIVAADAVAVVEIRSHHSYLEPGGLILTDYQAVVSDAAKGELETGRTIVITEVGGTVGSIGLVSSTAPRFVDGQRALVLLDRMGSGWTTHSGLLGKFDFARDASAATFVIRGAFGGWSAEGETHVESARDAGAFIEYVRDVARGDSPPKRLLPRDGCGNRTGADCDD